MKKEKKRVFVSGIFNTLHPGHIRLLKFAKSLGNELFVGVMSKNIFPTNIINYFPDANTDEYRIDTLKSINFIDKVVLIKASVNKTIKDIKPNIVVKGKEHEKENNAEEKIIKKIGAKLIFNSGGPTSDYDLISFKTADNKTNFYFQDIKKFLKVGTTKEVQSGILKLKP